MSYSSTKGANVGGVGGAVAVMLTRDTADFFGPTECMRRVACLLGVPPLSAQQALVD